jgi:hypothetical protein
MLSSYFTAHRFYRPLSFLGWETVLHVYVPQLLDPSTEFDEMWLDHYAIGGHSNLSLIPLNFLQSVITTFGARDFDTCELY